MPKLERNGIWFPIISFSTWQQAVLIELPLMPKVQKMMIDIHAGHTCSKIYGAWAAAVPSENVETILCDWKTSNFCWDRGPLLFLSSSSLTISFSFLLPFVSSALCSGRNKTLRSHDSVLHLKDLLLTSQLSKAVKIHNVLNIDFACKITCVLICVMPCAIIVHISETGYKS